MLLLVDNAGSHVDDTWYDGVQIDFLPPNTISIIQLMRLGIRRATQQHLVSAMDTDHDF